jgi:hypothetical protein
VHAVQVQERARQTDAVKPSGSQIIDTIKELLHEGNVRRISIKQDGQTIAEFPLVVGVVGAAVAPALAAMGAIAALVSDCTIEIERSDDPSAGRP